MPEDAAVELRGGGGGGGVIAGYDRDPGTAAGLRAALAARRAAIWDDSVEACRAELRPPDGEDAARLRPGLGRNVGMSQVPICCPW